MSTAAIAVALIAAIAYLMGNYTHYAQSVNTIAITSITCFFLVLILLHVLSIHEKDTRCAPVSTDTKPLIKKGVNT